jgi:hypothetical protein
MVQQRDEMVSYLIEHQQSLDITNGFHWVAHSQGALLARAVIQRASSLPNFPPIHTYVSMAGPQMGQWGQCTMNRSDIPDDILKKMTRPYGWAVFYNPIAQHGLSIANYWNDPNHRSQMVDSATLLPQLNGYDGSYNMTSDWSNFCTVPKVVFLGSQDDDCINPPLSSVFEFVTGDGHPMKLTDSMEYQNDTFGLRTMIRHQRLVLQNHPGLHHLAWRDPTVFDRYVMPHLLESHPTSSTSDE